MRYKNLFFESIDELIEESGITIDPDREDVVDVMVRTRQANLDERPADGVQDKFEAMPKALSRRYEIQFRSATKTKTTSVRDVKAHSIGQLVTIKAMVTRVSDVKPLVTVATYTCDSCGYELYQTVNSRSYTPLTECKSDSQEGR